VSRSQTVDVQQQGRALARAQQVLRRHKRLVQVGVLALIIVFLGVSVSKSWAQLAGHPWHVQWGLLVAALSLLIAQELSYAVVWRAILARMGGRLDLLSSQRIYLGAEFVRYIPGNVWHVITRVLWAEQRGVPKSIGFASMIVELATKLASGALVFAASLLFWPDTRGLLAGLPHGALVTASALLIPLLLFGLYPRLLRGALNTGLRRLGRAPVRFTLTYADVLLITLYWSLSWVVAGVGFYLLVQALIAAPLPATALPLAIGIYAIGWDIGFLAFVTPSGLGFREVALVFLLTQSQLVPLAAGAAVATVVAVVARLLATGAELICIAAAHVVRGAPSLPHPGTQGAEDLAELAGQSGSQA